MTSTDSFKAHGELQVGDKAYDIYRLAAVEGSETLPYSLKVLLENLLRTEDGANITADHIRALGGWDENAQPDTEIQFTPARVIMQDFTGVPCVVDLATMREAVADLGGNPEKINPLAPAELVIDHSVIIDVFGRSDAFERNVEIEYERNNERYKFLRWGQTAFDDFKVVPPGTGIVHQVNIEHLARTVMTREADGRDGRLPRHLRRHRQPHDDGQRPRRPRLGRRRHRGRGGHARPARVDAHPAGRRLQALRLDPAGCDRDRRRPHHHRDAARARCRRQVRRVLRRGCRRRAAGEPRDDRQHEPRVRLDLRDLPDRRRDARVPAPHRPLRRVGRPRRGLRQGAGPVAARRAGPARGPLLRAARARPLDGRALDRRPEAPAGPHRAHRRQGVVPQGAPDLRRRTQEGDDGTASSFPASDPTPQGSPERPERRRQAGRLGHAARDRPSKQGRHHDQRPGRPRSTTASSPSPRSRRAPTPRTRR